MTEICVTEVWSDHVEPVRLGSCRIVVREDAEAYVAHVPLSAAPVTWPPDWTRVAECSVMMRAVVFPLRWLAVGRDAFGQRRWLVVVAPRGRDCAALPGWRAGL